MVLWLIINADVTNFPQHSEGSSNIAYNFYYYYNSDVNFMASAYAI